MRSKNIVLLGQDGWADGRYGDFTNSLVVLNDSRLIEELFQQSCLGRNNLGEKMRTLADADAIALEKNITGIIGAQQVKKNYYINPCPAIFVKPAYMKVKLVGAIF